MKLPPLDKWIAHGKKLWDMATPTNRKLFFPGVQTWPELKRVLTKNWHILSKNPGAYEQETQWTHNALQIALDKSNNSQKCHDKAMDVVEQKDEG